MMFGTSGIAKIVLSILFFPMFFQAQFIAFAWGAGDHTWIMLAKRLLLLLPVCAIILACWTSMASVLTIPMRSNRRQYVAKLFITWWDLGRAIAAYWAGIVKAVVQLAATAVGLLRISLMALWSIVHDVFLTPVVLLRNFGQRIMASPIPWIAVSLTLVWCVIETTIFTYVTSPLVVDTFSNITGETLAESFIRVPLFTFLLFVVLGSYAVLSTFADSVKKKRLSTILGIGVIEVIVLLVEVVFLYREFVDSLVPWFAQYSSNFELGIVSTLAIACFAWFGVRSLSWFLFAAHGTPLIMAVIQGRGVKLATKGKAPKAQMMQITADAIARLKAESDWMQRRTEALVAALILPPLQMLAAALNFCTLLVITDHLFTLPFKDMSAVRYAERIVKSLAATGSLKAADQRGDEAVNESPATEYATETDRTEYARDPLIENLPSR